jgi:hypothetical protein
MGPTKVTVRLCDVNTLLTCSASCFNVLVAHNIPALYRQASDEGAKCRSWESDQRQSVSLGGGYYRIVNQGTGGSGRRSVLRSRATLCSQWPGWRANARQVKWMKSMEEQRCCADIC